MLVSHNFPRERFNQRKVSGMLRILQMLIPEMRRESKIRFALVEEVLCE